MKLDESGITRYRAYVLYGKSIENLIQRIVVFVGGCKNIIADAMLQDVLLKLCKEKPVITELKQYSDVDKAITSSEEGKAIVFVVDSPRRDVYAIAFVPVDKFNKSVVGGG